MRLEALIETQERNTKLFESVNEVTAEVAKINKENSTRSKQILSRLYSLENSNAQIKEILDLRVPSDIGRMLNEARTRSPAVSEIPGIITN